MHFPSRAPNNGRVISTRSALKVARESTPRETEEKTEEEERQSRVAAGLGEFLDARSSDKLGS